MPSESDLSEPSRPAIRIRDARHEDAAAIVRMIRRLAAHHGEHATLGLPAVEWDVLGSEVWASALVAEGGAALVGCALFDRHYRAPFAERCLDLGSLFVEPAWRGRGIGKALVEAVLRHAQGLNCSRVVVDTTQDNGAALFFCEKLGFEPAPVRGPRYQALVSPALHPS